MKERGIIFNTEMVRAILDGRKTQARRIVKSPAKTMQKNVADKFAEMVINGSKK